MLNIIRLNTEFKPIPQYMDEIERISCPKCKLIFDWGEPATDVHLKICEGDPIITLMKVEQSFKEAFRR